MTLVGLCQGCFTSGAKINLNKKNGAFICEKCMEELWWQRKNMIVVHAEKKPKKWVNTLTMKIEINYSPCFHIIVRDVFTSKENKEILKEALSLEDKFLDSVIGQDGKIDKNFRSNRTALYDNIYTPSSKRQESTLLRKIEDVFRSKKIGGILASSEYPLTEFGRTNTHETQVSRYGDNEQYKWHIDDMGVGQTRKITFVYYFHTTPKKFSGGEFEISNMPIYDGELQCEGEVKRITVENNMMIIFSSNKAHRVVPTKSPKTFKDGRFSVNCWVGMKW